VPNTASPEGFEPSLAT